MAFPIPTLKDLAERVRRAFAADLKGSDAWLWPNNVFVAAKTMAAAVQEAIMHQDYIAKQALVITATDDVWLEKHASEWGLARLPPQYASGKALLTGDVGVAVPAGLIMQSANGVQYEITQGGVTDGDGEVEVIVRAREPGRAGNAQPGVVVSLSQPYARINTEGEVAASGIGLGADVESNESLRSRILFLKRNRPMGGAAHDYVTWAREFNQAITRVFVDPITADNGRTTIGIWFLMDDTYENGIPQQADADGLAAYLETVRPAGAVVEVEIASPQTVNIEIEDLAPNTAAVQDAIKAELKEMFRRTVKVSTETEPFKFWRSLMSEAISNAPDEKHHTVVEPDDDEIYTAGQIPVLGTVTFS